MLLWWFLSLIEQKTLGKGENAGYSQVLATLKKRPNENIVEKGENAGNQHFLLFPQSFSTLSTTNFIFTVRFHAANAFNLDRSKIYFFAKEFTFYLLLQIYRRYFRKQSNNILLASIDTALQNSEYLSLVECSNL